MYTLQIFNKFWNFQIIWGTYRYGRYSRADIHFTLGAATGGVLWHRCFPVNSANSIQTPFLKEHVGANASVSQQNTSL